MTAILRYQWNALCARTAAWSATSILISLEKARALAPLAEPARRLRDATRFIELQCPAKGFHPDQGD